MAPMQLTIREAAALLGRSPRAVRARIARGELQARRNGRQWTLSLHDLPLTAAQRESMTARATTASEALAAVAPAPLASQRTRRARSIRDFGAFVTLRRLLRAPLVAGAAGETANAATSLLREGALALCAAEHEYDPRRRRDELLVARNRIGKAIGALLLDVADDTAFAHCDTLEREVLPAIGGLLRWTEGRMRT